MLVSIQYCAPPSPARLVRHAPPLRASSSADGFCRNRSTGTTGRGRPRRRRRPAARTRRDSSRCPRERARRRLPRPRLPGAVPAARGATATRPPRTRRLIRRVGRRGHRRTPPRVPAPTTDRRTTGGPETPCRGGGRRNSGSILRPRGPPGRSARSTSASASYGRVPRRWRGGYPPRFRDGRRGDLRSIRCGGGRSVWEGPASSSRICRRRRGEARGASG